LPTLKDYLTNLKIKLILNNKATPKCSVETKPPVQLNTNSELEKSLKVNPP
jgi:hypothetical protein